jgi:hypothetical protein
MLDDSWNRKPQGWHWFIDGDWGFSAPSGVYFCVQPREHVGHVAAHSLVLLDEIATAYSNDLNKGLGWPPGKLAEAILEKCKALSVNREGVFDDYRGPNDTPLAEFRRLGVHARRPQKLREIVRAMAWCQHGAQTMRIGDGQLVGVPDGWPR